MPVNDPSLPSRVAVLGAGTMGPGIAATFAQAGSEVCLFTRRSTTLEQAEQRIREIAPDARERVTTTTDAGEAFAGAELVIETIAEELEPKLVLLAGAESLDPDAIVTSNTSSLPLESIAAGLARPERFAGLHWFNPPELVELVEVTPVERTDREVVPTLVAWMDALGKAPVVLNRDSPGLIANRLQYALLREAYALVDAGVCSIEDVDRALTHGLGVRWSAVGPFETMDLAGLDVHAAVVENLFPTLSNGAAVPQALERVLAGGGLGCKNGNGLRGTYTPADVQQAITRRDRILKALPRLRDEAKSA